MFILFFFFFFFLYNIIERDQQNKNVDINIFKNFLDKREVCSSKVFDLATSA